MLQHQYADLFEDRDAKWKNDEKNMNVSALFLFLPLYSIYIMYLIKKYYGINENEFSSQEMCEYLTDKICSEMCEYLTNKMCRIIN